jgi:hypothetical protein
MTPSAATVQTDQQYLADVKTIAHPMVLEICDKLDQCVARKMSHRTPFVNIYPVVFEAATQAASQMSSTITRNMDVQMDSDTMVKIHSKVIDAASLWAAKQLATKPPLRSMRLMSFRNDCHPADTVTNESLKTWSPQQKPTES